MIMIKLQNKYSFNIPHNFYHALKLSALGHDNIDNSI